MRNHGLLTCGATIQQAFNTMYQLELSCRSQVDAMAARTDLAMPGPNVLAHTAALLWERLESQFPEIAESQPELLARLLLLWRLIFLNRGHPAPY